MQPPKGAYRHETFLRHRRRPVHFPVRIGSIHLEDAIATGFRGQIERLHGGCNSVQGAEEAQAALSAIRPWARYQRQRRATRTRIAAGHRNRQLVEAPSDSPFGLTVSHRSPASDLRNMGIGGEKEWRSQTIQAYKRLTKRAEDNYSPIRTLRRHQHAPCPPSAGRPVRGQGRQGRPRAAPGARLKTDWESWQGSGLVGRGHCPAKPVLDGTGVKARLDRAKCCHIPLLAVAAWGAAGRPEGSARGQEHGLRGDRGGLAPCPGVDLGSAVA